MKVHYKPYCELTLDEVDEAGGAGVQQVGGGGAVALAGELVAAGPGPGAEVGALGEQHQLLRGLALVVSVIELETKVMRRFSKISQSRRRPLLGLLLVESGYYRFHI